MSPQSFLILCFVVPQVDVLPPEADSSISMLQPDEKPDISYADIGGMDMQKQEVRVDDLLGISMM